MYQGITSGTKFYSALTLTYLLINFHLTFQQNIGIFWCHGVDFFSASSSDEQMPHLRMVYRTHLTGYLLYYIYGKTHENWGWLGMDGDELPTLHQKKWNTTVFLHDSTIPWVARDPGVRPRRVMGRDKPRFQGHPRNFWVSTEVAEKIEAQQPLPALLLGDCTRFVFQHERCQMTKHMM